MSVAQERIKQSSELNVIIAPYALSYVIKFGDKEDIVDVLRYYESMQNIDDETKMDVAEAYCRIGDSYNANRVINSIDSTSKVRSSLKYLAIKPGILELNGDFAGALMAYRNFSTTIDSIHQNIFLMICYLHKNVMKWKNNLMDKQRFDRIIWLSLCIVFILLIITGYIYYRYRLGRAKSLLDAQERKRLQLEQEYLKRENENLALEKHNAVLENKLLNWNVSVNLWLQKTFGLKFINLRMKVKLLKKYWKTKRFSQTNRRCYKSKNRDVKWIIGFTNRR